MTTFRIRLRPIRQEDIASIHRGLSDPTVTEYYAVHFPTLEATQEQMDWYAALISNQTGAWFAVEDVTTGAFVGAGGFNDVDSNKKGEIGFWLLPQHWGKGYMSEAMPLLITYGHTDLGLHRIEGFVDHENVKCKRAMDKVGLKYEGTMVDCELKDGKFRSIDIYARVALD